MTTVVERTIGTGGDYTTLQAWEDAIPASLVAADQIWRGLVLNQAFTSASSLLVIESHTTDATRYIELTTAPGASFIDHANKATNPLRWDSAYGASLRCTGSYAVALTSSVPYTRFNKLQIQATDLHGTSATVSGTGAVLDGCILESAGYMNFGVNAVMRNCLVIYRGTNASGSVLTYGGTGFGGVYNSTIVATRVGGAGTAFGGFYVTPPIENVYLGNFSGVASFPVKTTCYTSIAGPPSGWSGVVPFDTTTFENVTDGTHDFRLKAGSGLIGVGTTDATNAATDIIGTARPSGSGYDVGCWEYVASATGVPLSGLAQAVASAAGALAVGVTMTGAALGVATANGSLSTRIALSGTAAAIASASGTLTLGVVLSGAAIAQSVAAGTLGTHFALGGAVQAQTGASGSLAASSPAALAGDAAARAAATGTVTVQFALSGAAVAKASASGALAVGGTSALAGTAQAVPAASGALSVSIPLAGSAQIVAGVTGKLTTGSPLAGAAVAVAAAAGNLMVVVKLSGAALAQAMASGGLSLQVPLSAAAIAHANASGVLSGGLSPTVSDTRFTVRARQRNFTVTHAH